MNTTKPMGFIKFNLIVMIVTVSLGFLASCSPEKGDDGKSVGIQVSAANAIACPAGGVRYEVYTDRNSNEQLDADEPIKSVSNICNGANGDSPMITVRLATTEECSTGGYLISSTGNTPAAVCNGAMGLSGVAGLQGPQGQAGTSITPVKLCTSDHSSYPEYGLLIGEQLFAVYWGTTPGSPSTKQAFLALLTPGSYQSTGGNNCQFTIH